MLLIRVSESDRTESRSTGLFQTLSAGNTGQFGASGKNGAEAAPTGAARPNESDKARPRASREATRRLDEHTAFIAAIFAAQPTSGQSDPAPCAPVRSAVACWERPVNVARFERARHMG